MHGLDTRPVIIVQNLRKQASCPAKHVLRGNGNPHRCELVTKRHPTGHRPVGKPRRNAVAHFRRRGAGIGNAQDAVRSRAVKHQAKHTVGQKLGLAGAGIG